MEKKLTNSGPLRKPADKHSIYTMDIIDQMLDIDLQHWTPVRGWELRCHQYTTSSNSTTLESNKSDPKI